VSSQGAFLWVTIFIRNEKLIENIQNGEMKWTSLFGQVMAVGWFQIFIRCHPTLGEFYVHGYPI